MDVPFETIGGDLLSSWDDRANQAALDSLDNVFINSIVDSVESESQSQTSPPPPPPPLVPHHPAPLSLSSPNPHQSSSCAVTPPHSIHTNHQDMPLAYSPHLSLNHLSTHRGHTPQQQIELHQQLTRFSEDENPQLKVQRLSRDTATPGAVVKQQKNEQRLQKKAAAARESRKKKKRYVEELEQKVVELKKRIEDVKQKKFEEHQKQKALGLTLKIEPSPEDKQFFSSVQDMTAEQVRKLCDRFVSNPSERLQKADYYLDRVAECVLPGLQVKFLLWFADQDKEFYKKDGMWQNLLQEIGLTPEQIEIATVKKVNLQDDHENVKRLQKVLEEAQSDIKGHLEQMSDTVNKFRDILTPEQVVKFYLWTVSRKNKWAEDFLDKMWQNSIKL